MSGPVAAGLVILAGYLLGSVPVGSVGYGPESIDARKGYSMAGVPTLTGFARRREERTRSSAVRLNPPISTVP